MHDFDRDGVKSHRAEKDLKLISKVFRLQWRHMTQAWKSMR